MMLDRTTLKRLTEARTALVLSQPFFGTLALRLTIEEAPAGTETMSTNGVVLRVNRDFVESLTGSELRGVLAHEVMHCAMGHQSRRGARDAAQWNKACDYAINCEIVEAGFELPEGAMLDRRWAGKSAEEVFTLLGRETSQEAQQGSKGGAGPDGTGAPAPAPGGTDPGGCGGIEDAPADDGASPATEAELGANAREWEVAVTQAAQAARAAGKLPGALDRLASAIVSPKMDWRELLRRYLNDRARTEPTWSKPNRRMLASGVYFPGSKPVGMGDIVVAVDVSGSINQAALNEFSAELDAICADTVPAAVHVIYCNTDVTGWESFAPDDYPVTIKAKGGGGTDFRPPFALVESEGWTPAALIYFTDLECDRFPSDPGYPVLWAATGKRSKAPFGEVIRLS